MVEEFVAARALARRGRGRVRRHRRSTRRPGGGSPLLGERLDGEHASAPPTPTASPTSTSARCSTSTAATAPLATVTVVRPHLQWGVAELGRRPGRAASSRSRAASTGSTAASSASSRARSTTSDEDSVLEREPLERLAADGPAARLPPRGLLGLHGHLQGRGRPQRPLGAAARRPWRVWDAAGAETRVKRALVTGGHGFVASHLARALLERGDAVTVLDLAPPPLSGLALQGIERRGRAGRGRPARRRSAVGATLEAERVRRRLPPRRADAGRRRRWPTRPRPSRPTCAAPGTCWRPAAGPTCRRSSSPPPTRPTAPARSCPTARTCRCARPRRTRRARRPPTRSRSATGPPTACRWRSPASPTSTAAATSTSRA